MSFPRIRQLAEGIQKKNWIPHRVRNDRIAMNDLEKYLEKLQNANHHTKNMIMWIGTLTIMAIVVTVWLNYSDFGVKEESAIAPVADKTSSWETIKNGIGVTVKELGSVIIGAREKILQTNNLNFEAPENAVSNIVSTTTLTIASTTPATTTIKK
jgi:hypothetical protein